MEFPDNLRYTKDHEWVKLEGKNALIGVTDYAQHQLGDIVYVELPEVGEEVTNNETFGVLESVKAVSDCFSPLSGKVIEINELLSESPEMVNSDCYGEGWMMKLELLHPEDVNQLMDHKAYQKFIEEEAT